MIHNNFSKLFLILLLSGLLLTATACTKHIEDVKDDALLDKQVSVRGVVGGTFKIGSFTAYTLQDDTGSIGIVTSGELPREDARITVKGTLKKLFVYYIEVD